MANVTGNTNLVWNFTQTKTTGLPGSGGLSLNPSFSWSTQTYQTSGTGANACDLMYVASLTLAAAPQTLDLTSLTDLFGGAVVFVKVRELILFNKSTTDGQVVTYKPGASNGWTGFMGGTTPTGTLFPSEVMHKAAPTTSGMAVSGTSKTFTLDPGANTITVEIGIAGTDA